eukprot:Lithocolla_globosa_v1_NODE_684_length_3444_cov_23.143755.p3 type:complete len:230 gc:universal NODE_684_length_3444_cov_23.143755:427-1116(+)
MGEVERLQSRLEEYSRKLSELMHTRDDLQRKEALLDEVKQGLLATEQQLEHTEAQLQCALRQAEAALAERDKFQAEAKEVSSILSQSQHRHEHEEQTQKIIRELDEATIANAGLTNQIAEAVISKECIASRMVCVQNENSTLKARLSKLEQDLELACEKSRADTEERQSTKSAAAVLETKYRQLQSDHVELVNELADARSTLEVNCSQYNELKDAYKTMRVRFLAYIEQ